MPTWCNCGQSRMFQALVIPAGRFCLPLVGYRQCVRTTLVQLLGYVSAMWLSPARCACVGGNRFLYAIRVLHCDYSRVPRVLSTSNDSSYEPAMFVHFWLRRGRMVLRPHLYCLPSRFTLVRSLYWVLGFFGVLHPWRVHQHVCLQSAGLLLGLGWWGLCYVTWFSPLCHALPQGLRLAQPSQLQATLGFFSGHRVSPSASLVAWVGFQPFPSFSGLQLRLLAGVGGVLHPVSGCSSCGGVCLVYR